MVHDKPPITDTKLLQQGLGQAADSRLKMMIMKKILLIPSSEPKYSLLSKKMERQAPRPSRQGLC